jgi:serine protease Do
MRAFGEIAERLRRSTVQVHSPGGRGSGSGIVWDAAGLIVTNAHVVRTADMEIELWDGRRIAGRIGARDRRRDLATIRVEAGALDAVTPGDSDGVRPGELVIAVGNPLGFAGAVSTGIVHSVGPIEGMTRQTWIRADVRLAPGNSGGPLADAHGRVIGINTAIVNGLGVAVPSNAAGAFLRYGPRPALGVVLRPIPHGLLLLEVDPEGAAAAASLRPGDVLVGGLQQLNEKLDSGCEVLRLPFFRGTDYTRVREVTVRVRAAAAEAA